METKDMRTRNVMIPFAVTACAFMLTTLHADGSATSLGETCEPTRPDVEGPYWLEGSPERSNLRIDGDGPLLDLYGSVVDRDCQPIAGAWIDIWQADDEGEYDKGGWNYRGHFYSDDNAMWHLETVVPGLYPGRTAHIHVKVEGASGIILTTQLYFPDLPENETDFFYHPDLEVTVLDVDAAGNMTAEFHFVLDETNQAPCPGDMDDDDTVNVNDLLLVIGGWGNPYTVDDLLLVIANWGSCP
jgi:protocatechuate 3,4-dioxygenase beta subunit